MGVSQRAALRQSLPKSQPDWQQFLSQLQTWGAILDSALKGQNGTATFAAATTVAVVFPTPMPSSSYKVAPGGNAAGYVWPTDKTVTGFTLNCSASNSNATDWTVSA